MSIATIVSSMVSRLKKEKELKDKKKTKKRSNKVHPVVVVKKPETDNAPTTLGDFNNRL
tara:strand:+ start:585 stop:761 length:177 start_codon:yes stop_codon:yes gene_type:complete